LQWEQGELLRLQQEQLAREQQRQSSGSTGTLRMAAEMDAEEGRWAAGALRGGSSSSAGTGESSGTSSRTITEENRPRGRRKRKEYD